MYSPEQVAAWASFPSDAAEFQSWIADAVTFVAANDRNECLGFGGLEPGGRIASLYVAPGVMRKGIASRLMERMLDEASSHGLEELIAEASEFSRPVFEKYGFSLVKVEHTTYKGVGFTRYAMRTRI